jgi:hypothetical protein
MVKPEAARVTLGARKRVLASILGNDCDAVT